MVEPKPLKPGDHCPNCDVAFLAARVPTPDQRRKAEDRENREPLPPGFDTASDAVRHELGGLHECPLCHYRTRFPIEQPTGN